MLAKLREHHYEPHWVARGLGTGCTFMIGPIVPDLMHPSFAEIAKAVAGTVRPFGYDVVIGYSNQDARREANEIHHPLARQADGLILFSAQPIGSSPVFERMETREVPYVLVDRSSSEARAPYVGDCSAAV